MAGLKPADYLFWAVKQQTGNSLRNLILIVLADIKGAKQGDCYPSHATIAKRCDCTDRAVRTQIAILEKMGFITVQRRAIDGIKTSNIYTLNIANTDRNEIPNDRNEIPYGTELNSVGVRNEVPGGTELGSYKTPNETPIIKHPIKHTPLPPSAFDDFYAAYPKKVGRADAEKAWKKLNPQPALINRIMLDIVHRVERGHWCTGKDKQFIPGPAPYLNGQKWTDEIIPRPDFKPDADFDFNDIVDLNEVLKIERR